MAMAHAVEGRFPFLDHRVVAFAGTLPPRMKMKVLNEKDLLKRAVKGLIPEAVRARKKQPYRAPDAKSFLGANGELVDYADALLAPDRLKANGIFDPAAVGQLLNKARAGQELGQRDNMAFVAVLSTQLLVDLFVNRFEEVVPRTGGGQAAPVVGQRRLVNIVGAGR